MTAAEVVWGKSLSLRNDNNVDFWLPLWIHLQDAAYVAGQLWDSWVPTQTKRILCEDLNITDAEGRAVVQLLAGTHDIGKCSPDFGGRRGVLNRTTDLAERMMNYNLNLNLCERVSAKFPDGRAFRHELLSDVFLIRHLIERYEISYEANSVGILSTRRGNYRYLSLASTLAGHHGSPASSTIRSNAEELFVAGNVLSSKAWDDTHQVIVDYIISWVESQNPQVQFQQLFNKLIPEGISWRAQIALTSLVILSDWTVSDEQQFNLLPVSFVPKLGDTTQIGTERYTRPIEDYGFPLHKNVIGSPHLLTSNNVSQIMEKRFGFSTPNEFQKQTIQSCLQLTEPSLVVLEAGMGSGKTEAGLLVAECFENKGLSSGFFFGLPTMATANAIFSRVTSYLQNREESGTLGTVGLLHSKAHLDEKYSEVKNRIYKGRIEGLVPAGWLSGKRQRLLNTFVIGTVDSFLALALKQKWAYFRHIGFMGKTIIVDEVHAMDEYMFTYLLRAIEWAAYYGCPVVLLSATLPTHKKEALVEAYSRGREATV